MKILLTIFMLLTSTAATPIIDSNLSLDESLQTSLAPRDILITQRMIAVQYYSFDGNLHQGQIIIHKSLANDLQEIFAIIKEKKFPIAKIIPISHYGWDDDKSMTDDNSSAFNYRKIKDTDKLSNHSYGKAIDINPRENPYIVGEDVAPIGSVYNPKARGTITSDSFIYHEFIRRGWSWGGDWKNAKDYQHFEKTH